MTTTTTTAYSKGHRTIATLKTGIMSKTDVIYLMQVTVEFTTLYSI